MKTKEFIKKVEELGYSCSDYGSDMKNLFIRDGYNNSLVRVGTKQMCAVSTSYYSFEQLNDKDKKDLLSLTLKYITTPVEEREEPKKYYLRLPKAFTEEEYSYLNHITDGFGNLSGFRFDSKDPSPKFNQTKFTQKEIDTMPNQDFIKTLIKEEVR